VILRFVRTGKTRDVAEFRPDGWPICPSCDNDELGAVHVIQVTSPNEIDHCYVCGPVEVVDGVAAKSETAEEA
jgi:hypothetical protein